MCNIDIMKDKIILASIDSFHQMTGLILNPKTPKPQNPVRVDNDIILFFIL